MVITVGLAQFTCYSSFP